jgi:hypothetical protein
VLVGCPMSKGIRTCLLVMLFVVMSSLPGGTASVGAQGRVRSVFPMDQHVLALWEFESSAQDLSGNGRDGDLLGGDFVVTPFGRGLRVGEGDPTGLDWSDHATLLRHPYTVEMVLFPEDVTFWRKIFSFDDASDHGWYYKQGGVQAYPNLELGAGTVRARTWTYLAFVSTAADEVEIYFNGESLGSTGAGFVAPPPQAIFFRDDTVTGRHEQLVATVEAMRISSTTRSAAEIAAIQKRLVRTGGGERPVVETIPTPQEVVFSPEVVGTNMGLALVLALGFGLVSTVFNSTLKENEEQMRAALRRRAQPVTRWLPERLPGASLPESWQQHRAFAIALLLFSAFIYAFLDPTFTFDGAGLLLYVSLFAALVVVTYTYDMAQGRLAQRFFRRAGSLRAFPSALLIALGCVLLSRLLQFQPGYLLGFAAAFVLTTDPSIEAWLLQRQNALLILAGSAFLLVTSLVAWLLTGLLQGVPLLHSTLALIFVAGLEGVLFVLLPLEFMDGKAVFRWNKIVWFVAFVVATYWFCQILLNPSSSYLDAFAESNVRLVLLMLGLYTGATAALWTYFRRRSLASEPVAGHPTK